MDRDKALTTSNPIDEVRLSTLRRRLAVATKRLLGGRSDEKKMEVEERFEKYMTAVTENVKDLKFVDAK